MAVYTYRARDPRGQLVIGVLEAETETGLIRALRGRGYTPVRISLGGVMPKERPARMMVGKRLARRIEKWTAPPVQLRDMLVLCTNLSSMISAGVPLMGALQVLAEQIANPTLRDAVREAAKMVAEGASFADGLARYPRIFSRLFVSMVRVGEMSGTMHDVLKDMASYMEQQEVLRQKLRGAMVYPAILAVAGTVVIIVIVTFVLPQFVEIFLRSGVELPVPTKIVYATGLFIKKYLFLLMFFFGAAITVFKVGFSTQKGRDLWGWLVLRIPLIGPLVRDVLVGRFTRTIGALLHAGVPLLQSLVILKDVLDNSVFANITQEVYDSAEKGQGVHRALMAHREFPRDVVYMISIGEESGAMSAMFSKVADFYESRVDFSVKELLSYIEPSFISILGVVVGTMMASVLLPMFDMIKTISR